MNRQLLFLVTVVALVLIAVDYSRPQTYFGRGYSTEVLVVLIGNSILIKNGFSKRATGIFIAANVALSLTALFFVLFSLNGASEDNLIAIRDLTATLGAWLGSMSAVFLTREDQRPKGKKRNWNRLPMSFLKKIAKEKVGA